MEKKNFFISSEKKKKKKLVVFIFNMFYRVLSNIIWTSSEFFQICNFGVSKYNFKVYPKKKTKYCFKCRLNINRSLINLPLIEMF